MNGADPLGLWSSADEDEVYAMEQWWWASNYAMEKWLSDLRDEVSNDIKCAKKQIVEWAIKWDYIENPTWWNIAGQVWAGMSPAWVAWDMRDLNHSAQTCEWRRNCSTSIWMSVAAFVPVWDLAKWWMKAEKAELKESEGFFANLIKKTKQDHHFIPWDNKKFTPEYEKITKKYWLNLKNGKWNKESLPHGGRHANEYLDWMLEQLKEIDKKADWDVNIFMREFEEVKEAVRKDPNIMYPWWWGR